MDKEYVIPRLLQLSKLIYGGEPFAKYVKKRNKYVFGSMVKKNVFKNIITENVAIYLIVGK